MIDLEFVRWHKEWKARKGVYKQCVIPDESILSQEGGGGLGRQGATEFALARAISPLMDKLRSAFG